MKDFYQILGVNKNSSPEEIKTAYRQKAKEHHPDKGGDAEIFKSVSEAYETLSDTQKKQQYDNPNPFQGGGFNGFGGGFDFNINDIFSNFGFRNNNEIREDLDIRVNVEIPFKSIYQDKKVEITFYRYVPCTKCDYTGVEESDDSAECLHCDGKGYTMKHNHKVQCTYCNSSGKIHTAQCKACEGRKVMSKFETLTLDNVYTLSDEPNQVAYRHNGHFSRYYQGRRGNLIITLIPKVDTRYQRNGNGLIFNLDIDYRIAINGGEIEYTHLDDKTYKIKIPTKSNKGNKLKMSNLGLLNRDKKSRGDLIIDLSIVIDYEI